MSDTFTQVVWLPLFIINIHTIEHGTTLTWEDPQPSVHSDPWCLIVDQAHNDRHSGRRSMVAIGYHDGERVYCHLTAIMTVHYQAVQKVLQ